MLAGSRSSARAGVVDLLDVALRARRADDVGGLADPAFQPIEPLLAHVFRQHGDAAAAEDARDGDAAAAIIAGRRPDRRGGAPGRIARSRRGARDSRRRRAPCGPGSSESARRAPARCAPGSRSVPAPVRSRQASRRTPRREASLNQWTRNRFKGWGASGSTSASRRAIGAGMVEGRSVRRTSAGRRRRHGNGRAFADRRRHRPDAFPARAAPNLHPFVVTCRNGRRRRTGGEHAGDGAL